MNTNITEQMQLLDLDSYSRFILTIVVIVWFITLAARYTPDRGNESTYASSNALNNYSSFVSLPITSFAWFNVSLNMSLEDSIAVEWAKRAFSRRSLHILWVVRFFYWWFSLLDITSRSSCFIPWLEREKVFSILLRRFWYSRSISFTPWLIFCFTSRRRIWISCSPSINLLWYRSNTCDRMRAARSGGSSSYYHLNNSHSSVPYPILPPSVLPWQNTLNDSPTWQQAPNTHF